MTKNKIATSLVVLSVAGATLFATGFANNKINISLDGQLLTQTQSMGYAYLNKQYNRTMVPLRLVSEEMGYKVDWDKINQTATIIEGDTTVKIAIGSQSPTVNGATKTIDAPAVLKDDRTYVPVRFISEAMGETVDYKDSTVFIGGGVQLPTVEGINGTATYDYAKDSKVLMEYLGKNQDPYAGGPIYKEENSGTLIFGVSEYDAEWHNGSPFTVQIEFLKWPNDYMVDYNNEVYGKQLATAKEILKFYLPNGHEELYQIIDDGFNDRLENEDAYIGKDLVGTIGDDGVRVEIALDGSFCVRITK